MRNFRTIFTVIFISFTSLAFSQEGTLSFSLQLLPDMSWGVFVKPDKSIVPSQKTNTGTGQVTIVAPVEFEYNSFTNHGGNWTENARVNNPEEALGKAYISFGFVDNSPKLQIYPNDQTLLFSFRTSIDFNGNFYLFENGNDPFEAPNSVGSNPGNEIGMIDFGAEHGVQSYRYAGNYSGESAEIMAIMFNDEEEEGNNEDEEQW